MKSVETERELLRRLSAMQRVKGDNHASKNLDSRSDPEICLSRKAAKIAKTAPFTGYKTDFLRALRLGEKSSLPIPNRPSPCIGILPS